MKFFSNPFIKSILTVLAGSAAAAVDQAVTGGALSKAFGTTPQGVIIGGVVSFFIHNLISKSSFAPNANPPVTAPLLPTTPKL